MLYYTVCPKTFEIEFIKLLLHICLQSAGTHRFYFLVFLCDLRKGGGYLKHKFPGV